MDRNEPVARANDIEQPVGLEGGPPSLWGSDAIADVLRELGIPWIALNPGASFRGLHDSLVNYLGNRDPQMLLCLHEESAVALAHGWAKVTGRPIAAAVHSNVGLMHATMAVFDAWCDRAPLLLIGATGHVDAARRRPWIEWIHTVADQAALIRNYIKFDDQPASVAAARESILKAWQIATTPPMGPVYINLDVALQEGRLDAPLPKLDFGRYCAPPAAAPNPEAVAAAAEMLAAAKQVVILAGRVGNSEDGWKARVALAEKLGARVLTDIKTAAAFPTDHPLHAAAPNTFVTPEIAAVLKAADAIISLDWVDLAGTLRTAFGGDAIPAKIIQCSVDQHVHHGWSKDHQGLPPADFYFLNEPDRVVAALLEALAAKKLAARPLPKVAEAPTPPADGPIIDVGMVARRLKSAVGNRAVTLLRTPLSWGGHMWHFRGPKDYIGLDGGGGVGSGPGIAVGAALALKGSGRLPISIMGDGDFLMSVQALWTAAHYKIPMLILVVNNRSFFNDEIHQERVARARTRPVANRWIGQRIGEPEIDLAMMARAQGCRGIGPVTEPASLEAALAEGIRAVEAGHVCVIDIRIAAGYDAATAAAMAKSEAEKK
ncbi:MAG: thiamine pyrophosphate-binding protein [Rhodospirillaceae bacterium]|nr:thiamine pyrophosphate-binding protein [Rhodospirillaceae bacterium]